MCTYGVMLSWRSILGRKMIAGCLRSGLCGCVFADWFVLVFVRACGRFVEDFFLKVLVNT